MRSCRLIKSLSCLAMVTVGFACLTGFRYGSPKAHAVCKSAVKYLSANTDTGQLTSSIGSPAELSGESGRQLLYVPLGRVAIPVASRKSFSLSKVIENGDMFEFIGKGHKSLFGYMDLMPRIYDFQSYAASLPVTSTTDPLTNKEIKRTSGFWKHVAASEGLSGTQLMRAMTKADIKEVDCSRSNEQDFADLYALYAREMLLIAKMGPDASTAWSAYATSGDYVLRRRVHSIQHKMVDVYATDGKTYLALLVTSVEMGGKPVMSSSIAWRDQPRWLKDLGLYITSHGKKGYKELISALKKSGVKVKDIDSLRVGPCPKNSNTC